MIKNSTKKSKQIGDKIRSMLCSSIVRKHEKKKISKTDIKTTLKKKID